jgi:hypothetical protein
LLYTPIIRKAGAHWPTKSDQASLPMIFRTAEPAIEAIAAPRYPLEGIREVWDSMLDVNWSSRSPRVWEVVLGKVIGKLLWEIVFQDRDADKMGRDALQMS